MAKIIEERCIGCILCAQICPEVFMMKKYKAVAYVSVVPRQAQGRCRQAANECPVDAIEIERSYKNNNHHKDISRGGLPHGKQKSFDSGR